MDELDKQVEFTRKRALLRLLKDKPHLFHTCDYDDWSEIELYKRAVGDKTDGCEGMMRAIDLINCEIDKKLPKHSPEWQLRFMGGAADIVIKELMKKIDDLENELERLKQSVQDIGYGRDTDKAFGTPDVVSVGGRHLIRASKRCVLGSNE